MTRQSETKMRSLLRGSREGRGCMVNTSKETLDGKEQYRTVCYTAAWMAFGDQPTCDTEAEAIRNHRKALRKLRKQVRDWKAEQKCRMSHTAHGRKAGD